MGFNAKIEGVNSLVLEFSNTKLAQLSEALDSAQSATDTIIKHSGWKGNKAENTKDYLTYAHGATINTFMVALKSTFDHLLLYRDAAEKIEAGHDAIIPEQELLDLSAKLLASAAMFSSIDSYAKSVLKSVESIGYIPFSGLDPLAEDAKNLSEKLDKLGQDINANESAYKQMFESDKTAYAAIRNMIYAQHGMDPSKFSAQSLANNKTYQNLGKVFQDLCTEISNNKDSVKAAQESYQKTHEALVKEYEERKKEAEKKAFWLGVATVVGSAVIIAATGGAGAVLIGGIAGAINAAGKSYFDQSVGSVGCVGRVDIDTVIGAGAFGFATGALTSWAGGAISAQGTSVITKYGLEGTKKVLTKAAFSGLTSVANGTISRVGDACYDSIRSGESVLDTIENIWDAATDGRQLLGDFAGGFVGSVVSQKIESGLGKLEEKLFPSDKQVLPTEKGKKLYTPKQVLPAQVPSAKQQAYQVLSETVNETGKGMGKRFASTLVKKGDIRSALTDSFDLRDITSDVITTVGSETAIRAGAAEHHRRTEKKLDEIQKELDRKLAQENEQNAELCKELGIKRSQAGVPDCNGKPQCICDSEYEAQFVDPKEVEQKNVKTDNPRKTAKEIASNWEKKNAYDNMVKSGKLDGDRYKWEGGGVTDMETGKRYTMHHYDYNVKTGKGRMQLVEKDYHAGIHHSGSASARDSAYNDYHVGDLIAKDNHYYDEVSSKYNNMVQKGVDNSKKVTSSKQEYGSRASSGSAYISGADLEYNPEYQFLPVGG